MAAEIPLNTAPRFVTPVATPTYGAGGSASIICSTHIAAPPATVAGIILDTTTYPSWNKWIPKVAIDSPAPSPASSSDLPSSLAHLASNPAQHLLLNAGFHFEVHTNPESPSFQRTDLVVSVLEEFERNGRKGIRVSWKTKGDPWYLRAERTQEFLATEDGMGCDYFSSETFFGPVTWAIKMFLGGQLKVGFTLWMEGLKEEAEKRAKGVAKSEGEESL
ncbi:uncharacterized protein BCR38DRAFT_452645 [Pseudomassariella vexata]|uniref:Coenzyme Q-binding protein COQ10 START domain-containing protein n=1 Tax=Pseudomassariella vexata TaxID=1141098 RepID=A0A1Y2D841_9PEZI|nr:uncharacterized protein BCR38DRAFT_452645 [Pseudomassariella vexata]ORY55286.1 hypothetical protein BCR38DRAFT_452645 [Pseudomassariella vexata]